MDDLTQRRRVHNEQLFREVNEAREEAQPGDARELTVVCECADQACIARITLARADYEAVRSVPNRFIIVTGHQVAEIERVVEQRGAFAVVEKRLAA